VATIQSIERTATVEDADVGRSPRDRYVLTVVVFVVLAEWIRPLGSSLWLDETGTFFVLRAGDLHQVVHRALDFQGQFPLYYTLLWGWTRVFGMSEVALRLPSVFAGLASIWLVNRVALRLFDDVVIARLASCVLVMLGPVSFAAADARPYALTLAVFLGATLLLLRWLDGGRALDGLAYLLLAALTLYLHYLFGLAYLAHAVLIVPRLRRMGRRGAVVGLVAVGVFVALLVPAVPHLVDVYGRREAMSLFTYGSTMELLTALVPPTIVLAFLAGRFAGRDQPLSARPPVVRRDVVVPLLVWAAVPPTTLYLAGQVTGVGLWADRHFLSYAPAVAILSACAFAVLTPARQRIAVAVLAILFAMTFTQPGHEGGDWRAAARAANALSDGPNTPVLVYTGFSESRRLDWAEDPERSQLFLAPFLAYPIEGRMHALPLRLTPRAKWYVAGILATASASDRILLVTDERTESFDVWIGEVTRSYGFTERLVEDLEGIRILSFDRSS
jgi:4-amino-4-deoxy-L-arabinose transferase-like glycosyltransferase